MKNGDYTLIFKGKLYRFPTEKELYEFIQENNANTNGYCVIIPEREVGT